MRTAEHLRLWKSPTQVENGNGFPFEGFFIVVVSMNNFSDNACKNIKKRKCL
jgi:hypothetical protein